jgi:SAM-dependent methyltransferase
MPPSISEFLTGDRLYGDDFTPTQIAQWFDDEQHGYFDLVEAGGRNEYGYDEINRVHGFSALGGQHFKLCIALGCADGADVVPMAPQIDRFYCVEPARQWWKDSLNGTPAQYVAPVPSGDLALPDGAADLAISLGVLHHIPNVSHVLKEIARVLRPGGTFVLREPISWMGDWRNPRRGLTKNERGLPLPWLDATMQSLGFVAVRKRLCFFSPLRAVAGRLGLDVPYNRGWYVKLDRALSIIMSFNVRYARRSFWEKCAPSCVFTVYRKAE